MKTLGIIGGLGPESTLDYYQRIIALFRERTGNRDYPEFVIVSVDLRKGLDFMDANDLSGMANYLLEGIDKLARSGAGFGIISANTPHIVFDEVAPKSPIPLISIVEATCAAAKMQDLKRLALFGTRYTMQAPFYPKVFVREGIDLLVPDLHDQAYIHDKYMNELVPGKFLGETRAGLLAVVDRMKGVSNIDGVIDNQLAMAKAVSFVLTRGQRNVGMAPQIGEQLSVVLINGFFEPGNAVGLDQLTEL